MSSFEIHILSCGKCLGKQNKGIALFKQTTYEQRSTSSFDRLWSELFNSRKLVSSLRYCKMTLHLVGPYSKIKHRSIDQIKFFSMGPNTAVLYRNVGGSYFAVLGKIYSLEHLIVIRE